MVIELALVIRVMLRRHREPASRIAWIAVITALPWVGILAYILFGEVNIGRRRVARLRNVLDHMPGFAGCAAGDEANFNVEVPQQYAHLFRLGHSVNGFHHVGGNSARLLAVANATSEAMCADSDAARRGSEPSHC